ncbi:hypothetical protein AB0G67_46720 [Streptomyces sp. NPDC021056]|uniref:hypothetical protein n=1 Tax=Streptomyces sp. NPDC021056 TaxID=3155012 RepID=UPI0033FC7922
MAVEIEFTDRTLERATYPDMQVTKTERHEYYYDLLGNGALALYRAVLAIDKKGETIGTRWEEIAFLGPAAGSALPETAGEANGLP